MALTGDPIDATTAADWGLVNRVVPDDDLEDTLQEKINSLTAELEKLNPNMRAMERLESVKSRLESTEKDFEDSRAALRAAREAFTTVKEKRFNLFNRVEGSQCSHLR